MSLLDRIAIDPQVVHGRAHIKGTRMRVSDVLSHLAAGRTAKQTSWGSSATSPPTTSAPAWSAPPRNRSAPS